MKASLRANTPLQAASFHSASFVPADVGTRSSSINAYPSKEVPPSYDALDPRVATRGGPTGEKQALLGSWPEPPAASTQSVRQNDGGLARAGVAWVRRRLVEAPRLRRDVKLQVAELVQEARKALLADDAETAALLFQQAFAAYEHHSLHGSFSPEPFFGLPPVISRLDKIADDGALLLALSRDHNEVSVAALLSIARRMRDKYKYSWDFDEAFSSAYRPAAEWMDRHGTRAFGAILRGDDAAAEIKLRALQVPLTELRALFPPKPWESASHPVDQPDVPCSLAALVFPGFAHHKLVAREEAGAQLVALLVAKRCVGTLSLLMKDDDGFLTSASSSDQLLALILAGEQSFEAAQSWTLPFYTELLTRLRVALVTPQTCAQAQDFLRGLMAAHPAVPTSLQVGLLLDEGAAAALPPDVAAWLLAAP